MERHGEDELTFRCPVCEESLKVNDSMMQALIEKGCVVCGADLTVAAFTAAESLDSGADRLGE